MNVTWEVRSGIIYGTEDGFVKRFFEIVYQRGVQRGEAPLTGDLGVSPKFKSPPRVGDLGG